MKTLPIWAALLYPCRDQSLVLDLPFQELASYTARVGPLPAFSRASAGTFVGSNGLIQTAGVNVPRLDYDPTTLVSLGAKNEPQSTNVLLRSEEFSNAAWAKTLSSVTANVATAPDGAVNADKLVEDTSTNVHTTSQTFSTVSGTTYTFSVFIKAAERTFAAIALLTGFPTASLLVNLSTGAVTTGTGTPINGKAEAYINGWYRVSFSLAANATTASATVNVYILNGFTWANRIYTGDGSSGILIWGAQLEALDHATSYIPTTNLAVVRFADLYPITGVDFAGFWNASEGTMVFQGMKAALQGPLFPQYVGVDNGTTANRILMFEGIGVETFQSRDGAVTQADLFAAPVVPINTAFGIASRYKANDFALSLNGASAVTDVSGTVPAVNQMTIGSRLGSAFLSGWIRSVKVFNKTKTNAQLRYLSLPS